MLRKGHGRLYKAPTKEERRSEKLRGERDQIKFIDLRFERWKDIGPLLTTVSLIMKRLILYKHALLLSPLLICF